MSTPPEALAAMTYRAAGDCITVTESTQHPGILYIGTSLQDGTAGRVQIAVTRAEFAALAAGIKAGEFDDLIGEPS